MKVIAEVAWSHTLFEHDGPRLLTLLVRSGPIEDSISVHLSPEVFEEQETDLDQLGTMLVDIRHDVDDNAQPTIRPPVWPT